MANQEMKICAEEALNGNLEDCARLLFPQEGETMPKLRFSGFEGEWERKLLSECLEISEEKNTDNKFGIEDVLSVSDDYGVVNQIELLGRSYAGKSVSGYKILRPGQIVYTKSPLKAKPYGIVKQNTGEAGIVSVLYAVYNTKEGVAPEYIHYYFDPAWRLNAYMRPLVNKGAKNTMNISDETALTGYIMIPKDIEEQRRIATYLRSLDEQIAIQQQQLERLKKMKQSCLGLLFADNQSITPPLRFKGFSGEWETVLIKDAFDVRNGYTPSKYNDKYWTNGTIPWFRIEDIRDKGGILKDAYQKVTPLAVKGSGLFKKNSIIMSTSATIGVHAMLGVDSLANQRFTNFTIRKSLEDSFDPYFIYYAFFKMDEWAMNNTNSGGLLAVDIPGLLMLPFPKPSLSEQRLISSFLLNLDTQIDSLDKMLLGLMQMKKACLNQMIA